MWNIIAGTALAAGYLLVFWIFGAALPGKFRPRGVPLLCLMGFLLYFTLFQIVAFPMKYLKRPLSHLTVLWGCLVLVVFIFVLIFRRRALAESISGSFGFREKSELSAALAPVIVAAAAVGLAIFLGLNTNTLSNYDSNNYIGLPVASVYTNTLELVNPFSGRMLDSPNRFYILNTDTLQSAVIFQALKVHPLIERKWSFTIAMTLLFEMALYRCGQILFHQDSKKTTVFVLLADLSLLFSYSVSGVSQYFAYRTYEGKSVTCYMYTLLILLFCAAIYRGSREKWPWAGLFLCGAGGIAFCNTALYIIPCMTGLTLLPWLAGECIKKRRWSSGLNYCLVLLPSIVWFAVSRLV